MPASTLTPAQRARLLQALPELRTLAARDANVSRAAISNWATHHAASPRIESSIDSRLAACDVADCQTLIRRIATIGAKLEANQ